MKTKIYLTIFTLLMSVQVAIAQQITYGEKNNDQQEQATTAKASDADNSPVYYQVDNAVSNSFTTDNNMLVVCRLAQDGTGTDVICSTKSPEQGWGTMVSNDNANFTYEEKIYKDGANIYSIAFTDPKNGWAVGILESQSFTTGVIFHTKDGGKSWKIQFKGGTGMKLNTVGFENARNGWVKGVRFVAGKTFGILLSTFDGGNSWSETTLTVQKDAKETAQVIK